METYYYNDNPNNKDEMIIFSVENDKERFICSLNLINYKNDAEILQVAKDITNGLNMLHAVKNKYN